MEDHTTMSKEKIELEKIAFTDNQAALNKAGYFLNIEINIAKALESWRSSMFSFEWLSPEGTIKSFESLSEKEQEKRRTVEESLSQGKALQKPVLGIGIQDNVEIGAGRAEFLTLAAMGLKKIPVHIPKANEDDFKAFRVDIN